MMAAAATAAAWEEIFLPERCTALTWPVQNAAKKSPSCHSSRIRPDWTNYFAETATEKDSNPSEDNHRQTIKPLRGFYGLA